MILIKSVEIVEIEGSKNSVVNNYFHAAWDGEYEKDLKPVVEEICKGRRYNNPVTGEDVVIAVTAQVGGVLGLQYEAWDNMMAEHELEVFDVIKELGRVELELNIIKQFGFFKRLKCLFTGIK